MVEHAAWAAATWQEVKLIGDGAQSELGAAVLGVLSGMLCEACRNV
jgi:hypothetical protein